MTRQNKILITEALPLIDEELLILERHAEVEVCSSSKSETVKERIADSDVLMVVYAKITSDVISAARRLKGIVRYGIGVDNIDLKAATAKGIVVVNDPDYAIDAVADHAMALLLSLARKLVSADRMVKSKTWQVWTSPSLEILGVELRGKTLGLLGIGRIGRAVAQRAKSFGMNPIAYDPYITRDAAKTLGVELMSLDEVLGRSDFISVHAPLTGESAHIVNEHTFSKMKTGVFIVNTSRGPLIDQGALVRALESGKVGGAALDVYEKEPPDSGDPLLAFKNVILTPHVAWYTADTVRRLEMTAVQQALDILAGKPPANVVNPEALSPKKQVPIGT